MSKINVDRIILTAVKENPKKSGSAAHKRFALYVNNAPISASLKVGVMKSDISWDLRHGFIKYKNPDKKVSSFPVKLKAVAPKKSPAKTAAKVVTSKGSATAPATPMPNGRSMVCRK